MPRWQRDTHEQQPDGQTLWSTGATTQSIIVTTGGTYTVQVVDGLCISDPSNAITVTISPVPPVPTITPGGPTTFCDGGSVILTTNAPSGRIWQPGGQTTVSITVTTSGSYTVMRSNIFGCTSTSLPTVVTVIPLPTTPTITPSGPTALCPGDSVTLTSSSPTGNTWSTGATTQSITVGTVGSYWVRWFDGTCTSDTSALINVVTNPNPPTPTITPNGPTTFCSGDSVILTSSSAVGNTWSTGATTQSITVFAAGNYWVLVNDGNCVSDTSNFVPVTVIQTPATPVITPLGSTTLCPGDSVTLESSSPANNLWSTGATTPTITVSSAGSYSVQVLNGICISQPSNPVTIIIAPLPAVPTISVSGPTTFCAGDSVVLTTTSPPSLNWQPGGATTASFTVFASGSYTVSSTNAFGCTSVSLPTVVTVNPIPVTPTITASGPTTFCDGDSVTLTSSSASNNIWSTGATTQSITVSSAGNYWVLYSALDCFSDTSAVVDVIVNPLPSMPIISVTGNLIFCDGDSVILTSNVSTGILWSTGETTQSIIVDSSGTFEVTQTNQFGCSATSDSIVTQNLTPPPPGVSPSGPIQFCSGQSIQLTSSSPVDNVWSNGATTPSITVTTAGTYSLYVDNGTCISVMSNSVVVNVSPSPPIPVITANGPVNFCLGDSVTLTSSALAGNLWNTGATTRSIKVFTSGSYTVSRSNIFGCTSTSLPKVVTVRPRPATPIVTVNGATTFCAGDSVILTSNSAINNQWSNGASTQSIKVVASGSYTVVINDGVCPSFASAPVVVTVNPLPPTPTISASGPTTFCMGDSVILTSSSPTGNQWSTGATTQSITVYSSGNFTVWATDGTCNSLVSLPLSVTVNPIPTAPTISASGSTYFCLGDSVTLTSSSSVGNVWTPGGATTQSIVVHTSGTYTVSVTVLGCVSPNSAPMVVTVGDSLAPTIGCPANLVIANEPTFCGASVSYTIIANDNCPGSNLVQTSGLASGSLFPVGLTQNSFTLTDAFGNSATCSFSVTVNDTEVPAVVCPANISLSNDPGLCTATVGFCAPSGTDNCGPSQSIPGFTYLGSYGGHYYYKSSFPTNWQTAYQTAGLAGGHLASVSNAGENTFLASFVSGVPVWIGCSDALVEGTFLWVDGCPNAYSNWAPGQPDNGAGVEDFVEMVPGGLWTDQSPVATRFSIMELDGVSLSLTSGLPPFSPFPVGTTVNNIVATDGSGNTSACSFTVTVNDTEIPTITCPANVVVSNDPGQCAAIVTYSVSFNDNCAGANLAQTAGLASGSSFPAGTTSNSFTVTDGSGNTATCSFTVTVNDTEIPTITCPANVVVSNDPGQCAAIVTYSVSFNDNCAGANLAQTAGLASGSSFPAGTTSNSFTVTDGSGNTATCSFTVTVNDTEIPTITCPANVVVSNDPGQCAAIVTYSVTFNDNCAGANLAQTAGLASGSSFPSGTTSNSFTVTDGSGNTAACSFTVTVNDTEIPTITCPANVVVSNDPGQCAAIVTYSVSFNDNCAGANLAQTAGLASGSSFPSGITANSFTVTDGSGNTATCSFTVTVNDTEIPTITCPANVVVSNDPGQCAAIVTYSVTFNDNCAGANLAQTAGLASGSSFPSGTTSNSFTVTDGSGNTAACSFTVTVNDTEAPTITCPANVVVSNDPGQCAAIVTYSVSFNDNCAGANLAQTAGLASGSSFPSGTTSIASP
ncbi:MAG: HYR domain-containing protein [Bacteroidetes bacterium]|nr:HYR domain-containing protein [Bacteroidota bacterium]